MTGNVGSRRAIAGASGTWAAPILILAGGGIAAGACIVGGVAVASILAPGHGARGEAAIFAGCITLPLVLAACGGGALTHVGPFRRERAPLSRGLRWAGGGVAAVTIAAALAFAPGGGRVTAGQGSAAIAGGAILILFQAAGEEMFLRGWLQPGLRRHWRSAAAIIAVALLFAALHLPGGERSMLTLLNLTIGGVVFGLLAERSGGLAAPIGLHAGWNGAEQLLLGLDPNPGVGPFGALIDLDLAGPAMWGGSAEGLNASLPMTAVLILLIGIILSQPRGVRADSA